MEKSYYNFKKFSKNIKKNFVNLKNRYNLSYFFYFLSIIFFIGFLFYFYVLINKHTISNKFDLKINKAYCIIDNNIFKSNSILKLNGEWEFYYDKLLISEKIDYQNEDFINKYRDFIFVPSYWQKNKDKFGKNYPYRGVASYRLILENKSNIKNIGFLIRGIGGAYTFYINGEEIFRKGVINRDIKKAKLKFSSDVFYYSFKEGYDKIEIIIETQSDYYFKSGIYLPIEIGNQKEVINKNIFQTASDLFIFGIVFIMGFYHIILYFAGYKEKAYLYFGFFSIVYSYRIISTGVLIINKIFPELNINWDLRIYQIFLFLILPTFSSFIGKLFEKYYSKFLFKLFNFFPLFLILLNLIIPLKYIDYLLIIFEIFALFFMIYLIYILIISSIKKYKYTFIFFFGILILILSTFHDIIKDFGFGLQINLMPISIASFIYIQSLILSIRFSDEHKEIIKMSNELEKLNIFYQKFVPQTLLNYLKNDNFKDKIITGENLQTKMGMMLIKINNYNELSIKLNHEEIIKIMNMYFNIWSKIIRKNFGFIEKFSSEGILVLFPTNPEILLFSSKEILEETEKNILLEEQKRLDFFIVLHYGDIVIGTIGSEEKLNDALISEDLEYLKIMGVINDEYRCKVMVSEGLYEIIKDDDKELMRYIGNMKKGDEETTLYEYLGIFPEREQYLRSFYKKELEEMILFFNNKKFEIAKDILLKLIVRNNDDNILKYYQIKLNSIEK
ncbi:MAG: hypothetical protein N3A58_08810 [Spirochaetes bacterium]|nr:hypothetical protein [Spirochaetota bacterium]